MKPGRDHRAVELDRMKAAATPEYREQILKNRKSSEAGQCPKAELQDFLRAENAKARR